MGRASCCVAVLSSLTKPANERRANAALPRYLSITPMRPFCILQKPHHRAAFSWQFTHNRLGCFRTMRQPKCPMNHGRWQWIVALLLVLCVVGYVWTLQ
jgi:hypothetical protein